MEGIENASPSDDIRRPLLEGRGFDGEINDEEQQVILEEWNASVSAFVSSDGGDDNASCYCSVEEFSTPDLSFDADDDRQERQGELQEEQEYTVIITRSRNSERAAIAASKFFDVCTATLIPDFEPILGSYSVTSENTSSSSSSSNDDENSNEDESENSNSNQSRRQPRRLAESSGVVKFLKFVIVTLGSIALARKSVVAIGIDDRDQSLDVQQILIYEGDSILRDLAVFFVVGRMYQRTGVDTLEWMFWGLLANLYFESQASIRWMQHSATPYEMHCLWPWQLWAFAIIVVIGGAILLFAHAITAHIQGRLWISLGETLVCLVVFVGPVIASPYAHFHHWFAGFLFGMHANHHQKWWSRATMAYCWGMYVNGIAVYGRDPLLTCDYARFLAEDQNCPFEVKGEVPSGPPQDPGGFVLPLLRQLVLRVMHISVSNGDGEYPDITDWRNCSSSGYHP